MSVPNLFSRVAALRKRRLADVVYALLWKVGLRFGAPSTVHQAVFTRIYDTNEWGDSESRSGPGSTRSRGADILEPLIETFRSLGITTLLDAPCGDFNWMQDATHALQSYAGVDVVREVIARNDERYADTKHRFLCGDITHDALPAADAVLCRDALVHLSHHDIHAAIANFKRTGAKYLIATTFADTVANTNIRTGGWRALNLELEPFHFPAPVAVIRDVPRQASGDVREKLLGVWRLDEVPSARANR